MSTRLELIGQRFGRLIVQRYSHRNKHRNAIWLCRCDCGTEVFLRSAVLMNGHTQSCGCLHKDMLLTRNHVHGLSNTRLYDVWQNMKKRCFNKKRKQYKDWGGRGITICDPWMDFFGFSQWALSNGYRDDLTIERKDNNGNYCPENCTFIPIGMQSKNRRNIHLIEYHGEIKSISDWARCFDVKQNTITDRLRRGWNVERALNTPTKSFNPGG